uniref:Putative ovule protein n=1 Tax=Solanum chacoense TaxID=4108 RepID=A0A0V0GFS8_SOLCH
MGQVLRGMLASLSFVKAETSLIVVSCGAQSRRSFQKLNKWMCFYQTPSLLTSIQPLMALRDTFR